MPCHSFAEAGAQIFVQPGEGGLKGGVVLPVGEIGEVMFADGFRQIFAGGGSQTFPRAQGFYVQQPSGNYFDSSSARRFKSAKTNSCSDWTPHASKLRQYQRG